MNGSMSMDLQTIQNPIGPMLNVNRYCEIKKALQEAREGVFKSFGLTYEEWKDLKVMAQHELEMSGLVESETENGAAFLIETPTFIHTNSKPFATIVKLAWRKQ
jgi:hypothetical protein